MTTIHITDDTERYQSPERSVAAAIAEYAARYLFVWNEPCVVQCALYVYDSDEPEIDDPDEIHTFTLECVRGDRGSPTYGERLL
jgi:hypothetical protein